MKLMGSASCVFRSDLGLPLINLNAEALSWASGTPPQKENHTTTNNPKHEHIMRELPKSPPPKPSRSAWSLFLCPYLYSKRLSWSISTGLESLASVGFGFGNCPFGRLLREWPRPCFEWIGKAPNLFFATLEFPRKMEKGNIGMPRNPRRNQQEDQLAMP